MTKSVSLIALAAVVAFISFSASWVTSQPVWLSIVLVSSGVLAAGFAQSLRKASSQRSELEGGSTALAIRFAVGASVLACMTASMLWFVGLAA